ncbi:hypothetical protein C0993_012671, partial [Termitomyces sp. T159_Od127]
MATILYDNDSPNLTFLTDPIEGLDSEPGLLGGTATVAVNLSVIFSRYFSLVIIFSWLTIAFIGISIKLFGRPFQSTDVIVRIDGNIQLDVPSTVTQVSTIGAFYQSQILPDTIHNLTMSDGSNQNNLVTIDYITITAGESTPLQGERLIVDDNDPSVVFEGEWVLGTDPVLHVQDISRLAYENTTHRTSSPGASATFHFI